MCPAVCELHQPLSAMQAAYAARVAEEPDIYNAAGTSNHDLAVVAGLKGCAMQCNAHAHDSDDV